MIFDSIILYNFGAYYGRQEAVLTPEKGKPIILFGGMNGGGKSTLLDAIQLAFYGTKARISNRGKLGYREYLRQSINRNSDPSEGAGVTVHFRRMIDGEYHNFELHRTWHDTVKGIEEDVKVFRDGTLDNDFTSHWDESIEAYLPNGIAHLFFFDGEQIKELAEDGHSAEILGTAIHSLLGLDIVDRLETDLKVFERRKKMESLDHEAAQKLALIRDEIAHIDQEQENVAMDEGVLVNETGRLAEKLRKAEELFRDEGGDLYLRRKDFEVELTELKRQKNEIESDFRVLIAGPLPLQLVEDLLVEVENVVNHESDVRRATYLNNALEKRDKDIIAILNTEQLAKESISKISNIFEDDRRGRAGLAKEPLLLDAEDSLAPQLAHLRKAVLPAAKQEADDYISKMSALDEKIVRLESELERVPATERIAVVQQALDDAKEAYGAKNAGLELILARKQILKKQREAADLRMDKVGEMDMNVRLAEDDKKRILTHSKKVRDTLERFRTKVVKRHTTTMETLMLESFCMLLRKKELVKGLSINPETFETLLTGKDGKNLPFDRLSAGERQLLATALLWGLARASGRPVPTIIDTPLGRLDSSHRKHLIERYFPNASHQVLLLSTDEEIIGTYHEELKPYISRTYLLDHNEDTGQTNIRQGYFNV